MATTTTPNMGMVLPVPTSEAGPAWATELITALTVQLDAHDHSTGKGILVTPSGLNIASDLSIKGNNLTTIRAARFSSQVSTINPLSSPSDIDCLYVSGVDLYYNDGSSNIVRITQGGVVTGAAGTITGLPSGSASAAFASGQGTFSFSKATNTPANMDMGTIILRYPGSYPTPTGNFIAIKAPSSLASGYSLILPALPASSAVLAIDTGGNITSSTIGFQSLCPAGAILPYGGASVPTGWLICDGSAVSRSTFAALFTAISINYGNGDGSTTFNVPDLRGQFLRGVSGTSTNDPDKSSRTAMNSGGNTGNNVGSVQTGQIQSHSHSVTDPTHAHSIPTAVGSPGTAFPTQGTASPANLSANTNAAATGISIVATGGNETRPINAYVNFIIKT